MMELSVIIVNYNVKPFLEQTLHSVRRAAKGITHEVFVVDNNSSDDSCSMVSKSFPEVILIQNKVNVGFGAANNIAIKQARGKYILLLNPDTLIGEECIRKCTSFMDANIDGGALGVRMINGQGKFLPESKRNYPSPLASFFHITGLSRFLPGKRSKGSSYHASGGDSMETVNVDILPGAFMLIRKEALSKAGFFDEDFFMYGEDIDLSLRIVEAGFKNYYLPSVTIIHYKGESMNRGGLRWIVIFYKAMITFSLKQHRKSKGFWFNLGIIISIIVSAFASAVTRIAKISAHPVIDTIIIYATVNHLTVASGNADESTLNNQNILIFCLVWVLFCLASKVYKLQFRPIRIVKVILLISIASLVLSFSLPEDLMPPPGIIFIWVLTAGLISLSTRTLFSLYRRRPFQHLGFTKKRMLIVSDNENFQRIAPLITTARSRIKLVGRVAALKESNINDALGTIAQLPDLINGVSADEVLFCAGETTINSIISTIGNIANSGVTFKVLLPGSGYAVGSNSSDERGEYYSMNDEITAKRNSFWENLYHIFT